MKCHAFEIADAVQAYDLEKSACGMAHCIGRVEGILAQGILTDAEKLERIRAAIEASTDGHVSAVAAE